jgi:hypothetical protein
MRASVTLFGLAAAVLSSGCAHRRAAPAPVKAAAPAPAAVAPKRTEAQVKAGLAAETERTPYFPLMSQAEAHKALPTMFKGRDMPSLLLVAGLQPKSMEAMMGLSRQVHSEGDLDGELLNDVFWAVSSANDCFY